MNDTHPLISLIVPVYKVENYLRECLETLVNQTYDNYELLLVNDGSPDGSAAIMEEYAARYDFIRTFTKENGGLSDARNFGVREAKGDYITFVDSDDYVSYDYLEYLAHLTFDLGAELDGAAYQITPFDPAAVSEVKNESVMGTEEAFRTTMSPWGMSTVAVAKLYPKTMLQRHPFPVGRYYEDLAIIFRILAECERVAFGDKVVYYYRQTPGSITHKKMTKAHLSGLKEVKAARAYVDKHYPGASDMALYRVLIMINEYMAMIMDGSKESRRFFKFLQKEVRPLYRAAMASPVVVKTEKIRLTAIMAGYAPMKLAWRIGAVLKNETDRMATYGDQD